MKLSKLFVALLSALAIAAPSGAVVLTGASGAAANTVTDYSTASLVSFDLDVRDFAGTRLNFIIEADDLLAPSLGLNAIVRNFSGAGIDRFNFTLDGISFAGSGDVSPTFGLLRKVSHDATSALVEFQPPEWAEFHFGNPLALAGGSDWTLNLAGLRAGDTFSITTSVPEPATLTLMLAALALFSFSAKGRNKR